MDSIDRVRAVLNVLFMIGAVVSMILYFASDNKTLFFYACGASLFLKMVEFVLRFLLR